MQKFQFLYYFCLIVWLWFCDEWNFSWKLIFRGFFFSISGRKKVIDFCFNLEFKRIIIFPPPIDTVHILHKRSRQQVFIHGFMDPQLKRAFKRALRCYRFGNENTDHNCIRNRIETGLPGDTEMKVWTATITKKKQQYPGRKLIKRSECQRNIISGVLSSAGFPRRLLETWCT